MEDTITLPTLTYDPVQASLRGHRREVEENEQRERAAEDSARRPIDHGLLIFELLRHSSGPDPVVARKRRATYNAGHTNQRARFRTMRTTKLHRARCLIVRRLLSRK